MISHGNVHVIIFLIYFIIILMCCGVNICINRYLLICLLYENHKNSEKEKSTTRSTYCFISYFGTSWSLFVFCFLHPCLYVIYLFSLDNHVDSKWYGTKWSDFINIRSLKKEFRENWGAILDFPGVPNKNES